MTVLATGLTGFIGNWVLQEYLSSHQPEEIIALSSSVVKGLQTIPAHGYSFGEGYLLSNGCESVETVIHMGSFIPKSSSESDDVSCASSNIASTVALLAACNELPQLRRFVYISTVDVYGLLNGVISEDSHAEPFTLYGWSKLYCEKAVEAFCRQRDIYCIILRLGHVYGPGEEVYRKVMPIMIRRAIAGKPLQIVGDGSATRSFVYVGDVASSILAATTLDANCLVNVAGDEPIAISKLASMINECTGNSSGIEYVENNNLKRDCTFDCKKLRSTLLPNATPFADGLRIEIEYMKEKATV